MSNLIAGSMCMFSSGLCFMGALYSSGASSVIQTVGGIIVFGLGILNLWLTIP